MKILFTLVISFLLKLVVLKPLTKAVLQYLEEDKITFNEYRERYKEISCKLIVYGKMKFMYENETIDIYTNQTDNKRAYLDYLEKDLFDLCIEKHTDHQVKNFIK